jgi:hypothetical protein
MYFSHGYLSYLREDDLSTFPNRERDGESGRLIYQSLAGVATSLLPADCSSTFQICPRSCFPSLAIPQFSDTNVPPVPCAKGHGQRL